MNKVRVQSLNEYFNVSWDDFIWVDDSDYEQPKINQPWNKGKKGLYQHTEESKKKITGRPPGFRHTDEWKNKKSNAMRSENNHFRGKKHTEDANKRITARHRKHYRFTSPSNEVWIEYTTIREFSRKIEVSRDIIRNKWLIEELPCFSH
jgi:hypothetical protein